MNRLKHNEDLLLVHVTVKSRHSWSVDSFSSVVILGARQLPFCHSAVSVTLLSSPSNPSDGQRQHGEGRPAALRPWLRNGTRGFCSCSRQSSITWPHQLPRKPGNAMQLDHRIRWSCYLLKSLQNLLPSLIHSQLSLQFHGNSWKKVLKWLSFMEL